MISGQKFYEIGKFYVRFKQDCGKAKFSVTANFKPALESTNIKSKIRYSMASVWRFLALLSALPIG